LSVSDKTASEVYPEKFVEFKNKKAEEQKKEKSFQTGEEYDQFLIKQLGIVDKHNYVVLKCKELSNGTRILVLRHIWGLY
jgi:hypothetical protein